MEDTNPELERFRQQWREEVSARAQATSKAPTAPAKGPHKFPPISHSSASTAPKQLDGNDDEEHQSVAALPGGKVEDDIHSAPGLPSKEPQSALEHYEAAVERENQGNLGDSLNLYRKAFRVMSTVLPSEPELTAL